jgi:phosphoribosylformylglycinamidine synthase
MTYRVNVRVMPREGLLDPQGQAVEHALSALGFAEAGRVRIGRAIRLEVAALSRADAEARARQMCDKLLANPVTEDYLLEVEEGR